MVNEKKKEPVTMRDMDNYFLELALQKANNKKQKKKEKNEAYLAVVCSVIISFAIFYFADLEVDKWSIPVILIVSLLSTLLVVTDERKGQTGHFFGIWFSLAAFTLVGCIGVGLVFMLISTFL
jgi:hypothetical protein